MSIHVQPFILGPLGNNTYLLSISSGPEAVIIDPSFDIEQLIKHALDHKLVVTQIWLTHAHYDHFAGVKQLLDTFPDIKIGLHSDDQNLLKKGGLANLMGVNNPCIFTPSIAFKDEGHLTLDEDEFTIYHTPGHSPGHVVFYNPSSRMIFSGDLIFNRGIGRTDLSGGSYDDILNSIRNKIFTLPPDTIIYSGHGPRTTVGSEMKSNPFL